MNLQVILKITHERIIQTQILLVSSTQVFSCKFNLITFKFIHEFIQQLSSFKKLTQASFVLPVHAAIQVVQVASYTDRGSQR